MNSGKKKPEAPKKTKKAYKTKKTKKTNKTKKTAPKTKPHTGGVKNTDRMKAAADLWSPNNSVAREYHFKKMREDNKKKEKKSHKSHTPAPIKPSNNASSYDDYHKQANVMLKHAQYQIEEKRLQEEANKPWYSKVTGSLKRHFVSRGK